MLLPTAVSQGQLLVQMALTKALGTDGARLSSILVEAVFQTEPKVMVWGH